MAIWLIILLWSFIQQGQQGQQRQQVWEQGKANLDSEPTLFSFKSFGWLILTFLAVVMAIWIAGWSSMNSLYLQVFLLFPLLWVIAYYSGIPFALYALSASLGWWQQFQIQASSLDHLSNSESTGATVAIILVAWLAYYLAGSASIKALAFPVKLLLCLVLAICLQQLYPLLTGS